MNLTRAEIVNCRKSDLVQTLLNIEGQPYSLLGREPLVDIYNLEENNTLLMMGRQFAKSTYEASDTLMDSVVMPFFKTLYVSPRQDQTAEFSNAKLHPFIKYSPRIRELLIDKDCTDNVGKKTFKNGAEVTLKYAFHTADAIRGISADHVRIDELQDIITSNIPVIEECLSGSGYQWRTYAGTPKTLNNTLARKWAQSTQNEWVLKCSGCNKWNIIGMENISEDGLICKKCGKLFHRYEIRINKKPMYLIEEKGMWLAKKKISRADGIFMAGFRVPQLLSPMMPWDRVIEKLKTYPVARFYNEVLAMPYDNNANPLNETQLKAVCCLGPMAWTKRQDMEGTHLFLGVDWGHGDISIKSKRGERPSGYTVMCLGRYNWDGKFELLAMKRFSGAESDPEHQVNEVIRIARLLNVTAVGTDFGGGFMQNKQLSRVLGGHKIIEWQANDAIRVSARWISEAGRMIFNRTDCMTDRFVEVQNGDVRFFHWDEFREFAPDFLTICIDYRSNGRDMYYDHVLPDDCFHAYMMCKMTADHLLYSG